MKLMTAEIEKKLAKHPIGSTECRLDDAPVIVKYFGGCAATWLAIEGEKEGDDWILFGKATLDGRYWEYGTFSLKELASVKFPPFGLHVERDLYAHGTVKELSND